MAPTGGREADPAFSPLDHPSTCPILTNSYLDANRTSDKNAKLRPKSSPQNLSFMGRSTCVAWTGVTGFEKVEKRSTEQVPVSVRSQTKGLSAGEISVGDIVSYRSRSSTNSSPSLNTASGPISSLFEELLIMIFDDVITSESSSSKCRRRRATSGGWPLPPSRNLARVSRTWRSIIFDCPMLWRLVHLTPAQPIHVLKQHLRNSAPIPIHLTVHQWPFRNPIPALGPYSIAALTAQLQSILSPTDQEGGALVPASHRVESITIDATESSTFLNFVLQTWTGRGSRFPVLRHVTLNGNVCATWSRACFFDGRNAPQLDRLTMSNVVIAYGASSLPWGAGLNLTTLVWAAPMHRHGSLVVSAACFHHVVSSFPNLTTLVLQGHVVGLEFATLEGLEASGVAPLTHVRHLRVAGQVFASAGAAFMLFHLLPSVRRLAVRGRACSGPVGRRTVALALQALICLPRVFGRPTALADLEDLALECVDGDSACGAWRAWCVSELERWRRWRDTLASTRKDITRVRVQVTVDDAPTDADEGVLTMTVR